MYYQVSFHKNIFRFVLQKRKNVKYVKIYLLKCKIFESHSKKWTGNLDLDGLSTFVDKLKFELLQVCETLG